MAPSNSTLELITYILTFYVYSLMLILGSIGNLLNILLFFQKKLRITSCNNYFLAAAFTNLIALNDITVIIYMNAQPRYVTAAYCKIEGYIMNACLQMSRYLILTACFDRYALCSTNVRLRRFCNVRIARRYVIPCLVATWLIIPLHVPILTTVVNNSCAFIGVATLYNSFYGIIMIGIIPPGLMFIFSILIFHNLKLRQRRRQIHPVVVNNRNISNNENQRAQIKDQQVLAMLLVQVLAYVVSSTPYTVTRLYLVLKSNIGDHEFIANDPMTTFAVFVTDMLRFICPFTSFYLYILVSHLYRREMKLLIYRIYRRCSVFWKRNNDEHRPNYSTTNLTQNSKSIRQIGYNQQQNQVNISPNAMATELSNSRVNP